MRSPDEIDEWLANRLTSETDPDPLEVSSEDIGAVWSRIQLHGIALALCESRLGLGGMPEELREKIQSEARLQPLWEHSHRKTIVRVITLLTEAGIGSLVFKGTGLAYSVYKNPATRRRGDTDLLIRQSQLHRTREVLRQVGHVRSRDKHTGQETWVFDSGIGFSHALDLHWKMLGSAYLGNLMSVDDCFDRSIGLPRLADDARTLDPVLSFLRCAINQAFHGAYGYRVGSAKPLEDDRLIWRMDAHLLATSFNERQWEDLVDKATETGLSSHCLKYLERARHTFGTIVPGGVAEELRGAGREGRLQRYLADDSFGRARLDIGAAEDWRTRGEIVAQHIWPPEHHLRERFPGKASWPLPFLQLYRLILAPFRLLRGL